MGVGLHGYTGLNPIMSLHIWKICSFKDGLDAIAIKPTDRKVQVQYHKRFLKQLQFLPDRTANVGAYLCLGELPLDADIDRKTLSLLGSVLRQDCVERHLLERQILLKGDNSKSWFVVRLCRKLLDQEDFQLCQNC